MVIAHIRSWQLIKSQVLLPISFDEMVQNCCWEKMRGFFIMPINNFREEISTLHAKIANKNVSIGKTVSFFQLGYPEISNEIVTILLVHSSNSKYHFKWKITLATQKLPLYFDLYEIRQMSWSLLCLHLCPCESGNQCQVMVQKADFKIKHEQAQIILYCLHSSHIFSSYFLLPPLPRLISG